VSWFRVDDRFYDHPKVLAAGNAAVGLWTRCGTWSSDHLTDGRIPYDVARLKGNKREIDGLLRSTLWVDNGTEYIMPDYLEFNPSSESVKARRAADAERQQRGRMSRRDTDRTSAVTPDGIRASPTPTRPDPLVTDTQQPPVCTDGRVGEILDRYAHIAVERGHDVKDPDAYARKARRSCQGNPDLLRWLDLFPTAPADAIAGWLHGDKGSMAYYPRADELADAADGPEDAEVIPLRREPA
jgi:hypothetical protein